MVRLANREIISRLEDPGLESRERSRILGSVSHRNINEISTVLVRHLDHEDKMEMALNALVDLARPSHEHAKAMSRNLTPALRNRNQRAAAIRAFGAMARTPDHDEAMSRNLTPALEDERAAAAVRAYILMLNKHMPPDEKSQIVEHLAGPSKTEAVERIIAGCTHGNRLRGLIEARRRRRRV